MADEDGRSGVHAEMVTIGLSRRMAIVDFGPIGASTKPIVLTYIDSANEALALADELENLARQSS